MSALPPGRKYTTPDLGVFTTLSANELKLNFNFDIDEAEKSNTVDSVDAFLAKGVMTGPNQFQPWSSLTDADFLEWARLMRRRLSFYFANNTKCSLDGDAYLPIRRRVYDWICKREEDTKQASTKL